MWHKWTWCCPALCGQAERVCKQADPGVYDYGSNQEEVFLCNSKPGSQVLTSPGEGEAAPRSADPAGLAVPEPKEYEYTKSSSHPRFSLPPSAPTPEGLSLSMSSWLSYNSLCRQNWPQTQGSTCLCLLGTKVVRHNTCPIPPMVSFTSQTGARTSRGDSPSPTALGGHI